jgi:signal transduction histidine kinase
MSGRIIQLERLLADANAHHEKVDVMNELAFELRYINLEQAIQLSQQAIRLADTSASTGEKYLLGLAYSQYLLGLFEMQRGNYEKALHLLVKSLQIYETEGGLTEITRGLSACGRVSAYLSDFPNALNYHSRALKLSQKNNDCSGEAASLNYLGALYIRLGLWSQALDYLHQSLELSQKLNDTQGKANAIANCCICSFQMGDNESALKTGLESLHLYRSIGARQGEAEVLNSLGVIYLGKCFPEEALVCFQQSLLISEEIGDLLETARVLRNISHINQNQKAFPDAYNQLKRALSYAIEIHSQHEQMYIHQDLAALHKETSESSLALHHLEQANALGEAIFAEKNSQLFYRLEILHQSETARQEARSFQLKNIALQQEINERRRAEQALHLANEQLLKEISEHEHLITDLNAFSHMVAHDLKNPLSAITGYTSLLSSLLKDTEQIQALRYLEIISQTSFRMSRIIDEMLLFASVREQAIESHPINMVKIVDEVLARMELMIEQHHAVVVKPTVWPVAIGYGPWVEEIWANYLSNAIKYGGTPPLVELGARRETGGKIRFWVKDNGEGLNPDEQKKLFTSYTRLEKNNRQGYGFGLSIVQRILERLDGEVGIECSGQPGDGCVFSFSLPAATTADLA